MKNNNFKNTIALLSTTAILMAGAHAAQADDNTLTLDQGSGYEAVVTQDGVGNNATIRQFDEDTFSGDSRLVTLEQVGTGNTSDIIQKNSGDNAGFTVLQHGNNNYANAQNSSTYSHPLNIVQTGDNHHATAINARGGNIDITQINGDGNTAVAEATYYPRTGGTATINQQGSLNTAHANNASVTQVGNNNFASAGWSSSVTQMGSDNYALVDRAVTLQQLGNHQTATADPVGPFTSLVATQLASAEGATISVGKAALTHTTVVQGGKNASLHMDKLGQSTLDVQQYGNNTKATIHRFEGGGTGSIYQDVGSDGSSVELSVGPQANLRVVQSGVNNQAFVTSAVYDTSIINQYGSNGYANILQTGNSGRASITQEFGSDGDIAYIVQSDSKNIGAIAQRNSNNYAHLTQQGTGNVANIMQQGSATATISQR